MLEDPASTHIQLAATDVVVEPVSRAVEGQHAGQQYVQHDSRRPGVHGLTVRLSLDHLRSHELRRADAACTAGREGGRGVSGRAGGRGVVRAWALRVRYTSLGSRAGSIQFHATLISVEDNATRRKNVTATTHILFRPIL